MKKSKGAGSYSGTKVSSTVLTRKPSKSGSRKGKR